VIVAITMNIMARRRRKRHTIKDRINFDKTERVVDVKDSYYSWIMGQFTRG